MEAVVGGRGDLGCVHLFGGLSHPSDSCVRRPQEERRALLFGGSFPGRLRASRSMLERLCLLQLALVVLRLVPTGVTVGTGVRREAVRVGADCHRDYRHDHDRPSDPGGSASLTTSAAKTMVASPREADPPQVDDGRKLQTGPDHRNYDGHLHPCEDQHEDDHRYDQFCQVMLPIARLPSRTHPMTRKLIWIQRIAKA